MNSRNDVYIFGMGGHSGVVLDIIDESWEFRDSNKIFVDVLSDDIPFKSELYGHPTISMGGLKKVKPSSFITAVGDCKQRLALHRKAIDLGFVPVTLISYEALVSKTSKVGAGTVVVRGGIINSNATVGDCCIVNTKASVDHDCVISDGVHIAVGATLSGGVKIKERSMIGAGATVLPNIHIGSDVIIGAGAVVTKDMPNNCVAVGVPARIIS